MLIRLFEFLGLFHDVRVEQPVLKDDWDPAGPDGMVEWQEVLKMLLSTGCFGLLAVWLFLDRPSLFGQAATARRGLPFGLLPFVTADTHGVQAVSTTKEGCQKESLGTAAAAPRSIRDATRAVKLTVSALSIRASSMGRGRAVFLAFGCFLLATVILDVGFGYRLRLYV